MTLDKKIITQVIGFCNRDLVPDEQFKSGATPYPIDWFSDYFSFFRKSQITKIPWRGLLPGTIPL